MSAQRRFTPTGQVALDISDLAIQMELGGPGFINVPRWRRIVMFLKQSANAESVLGRVFINAAEKGIFASTREVIERVIPAIAGQISAADAAALGERPGNLQGFAELMGGYPLQS